MSMDTKTNNHEDTKSKILKVATELFASSGLNGVSTRELSKMAQCNIAAISYYFGGKEKLYLECLKTINSDAINDFDDILKMPADKNELEQISISFCTAFAKFVSQNTSAIKLLINQINTDTNEIHESFLNPILEKFEVFLSNAIKAGILDTSVDPKIISRMIGSLIVSQILFKSFKLFDSISFEELSEKIIKNSLLSMSI